MVKKGLTGFTTSKKYFQFKRLVQLSQPAIIMDIFCKCITFFKNLGREFYLSPPKWQKRRKKVVNGLVLSAIKEEDPSFDRAVLMLIGEQ